MPKIETGRYHDRFQLAIGPRNPLNPLREPLLLVAMQWLPETFHLLRPWWLLALLPLPWVAWRLWRGTTAGGGWEKVCDPALLRFLRGEAPPATRRYALGLLGLGWVLGVIALSGPAWEQLPRPVFESSQSRVLVLDLSRSMLAADVKPDRVTLAKFKLLDIARRNEEGQTALITYAGDAHVVSPLTTDGKTIENLVKTLSPDLMPVPGSNPAAALRLAGELLKQAGVENGEIILLTDGARGALDAAAALRAEGARVSVLGVGTPQGAPIPLAKGGYLKDDQGAIVMPKLDGARLQALAHAGGGRYAALGRDERDIAYLLATPSSDQLRQSDQEQLREESWREEGPWLLLAVIPLAALGFRRGWLVTVLLVGMLTPLPRPAWAGWADWWQRPDQQGAKALAQARPEEAARKFESPAWQGTAHFQAGEYEAAAKAFAQDPSARGHYNWGNALAHQGDWQGARDAFQKALELDPEFTEAKQNLATAEQALKRKPSNSQQNSSSNGDGQEGEDSAQSAESGSSGEGSESQDGEGSNAESAQADNGEGNESESAQSASSAESHQTKEETQAANPSGDPSDQPGEGTMAQNASEEDADEAGKETEAARDGEEQAEGENAEATHAVTQEDSGEEGDAQANAQNPRWTEATAEAQAREQTLNKIKDDPGGLLRNKFVLESRRRYQQGRLEKQNEPW